MASKQIKVDVQLRLAPYIEEYFCVWAIVPDIARAMHNSFMNMDLGRHLQTQNIERQELDLNSLEIESRLHDHDEDRERASFKVFKDVAIINVHGTLMKQVSSFSNGSSTVEIRRQVRAAMKDTSIKAILLHVESPGGAVPGTFELANDVIAARAVKPVHTFIEDIGASAAFWILSGSSFISANEMAHVGSIGTFAVIHDFSELASKEGIKVIVIQAGEMKAAGFPGTKITDEQIEMFQERINKVNDQFLKGLVRSERFTMAEAKALNTGRVFMAADAKKMNLIDKVETFDQAIDRVVKASRSKARAGAQAFALEIGSQTLSIGPQQAALLTGLQGLASWPKDWNVTKQSEIIKSELIEQSDHDEAVQSGPGGDDKTQPEPGDSQMETTTKAATVDELSQACPGASDSFIVAQLKAGATVEVARDAHIKQQAEDNVTLKAELETANKAKVEAEAEAETAKAKAAGAKTAPPKRGVEEGQEEAADPYSGDAAHDWEEAVNAELKMTGGNRAKAVKRVVKKNPDLHQAYIANHNVLHPPRKRRSA